ncbi:MAG TPA: 1-acyl-sn-glycerol-3-phosphate acyltransferase [Dyadobacter sp.]|nr:1-acyl-sn-glycerol-3-phosphate acyltransferase [Dyadobacter sp.]
MRRLIVKNAENVSGKGPFLLASNHPDSFFDALVIGSVLDQPIHTLTRGDVFKKPAAAFWLRQINLIPVFRGSEGRQYVKNHDVTTNESYDALKKGDSVVVFSEGVCVNEWRLRPLGKGTARMAHHIWFGDDALPTMQVVPTGLNYEHFRGPGKRVALNFGQSIKQTDILTSPLEYEKWLREFNEILDARMNAEILTLAPGLTPVERQQELDRFFGGPAVPNNPNALLKFLGVIGRGIHQPLYQFFVKKSAQLTSRSVFYDSVLFGMLVYIYPVLVVLLAVIAGFVGGLKAALLVFAGLPLLAWAGSKY